jgi:hypothetical protein
MPVIKTEIGRTVIHSQPRQIVQVPHLQNNQSKNGLGGVVQAVECLFYKCKALNSIKPQSCQRKKKTTHS